MVGQTATGRSFLQDPGMIHAFYDVVTPLSGIFRTGRYRVPDTVRMDPRAKAA